MINDKYYKDIKAFPGQFETGIKLAQDINVEGEFDNVVVCGMGGSAFYVELINDYLASKSINLKLHANRNYTLPSISTKKTLHFVASYSGNTEEVLSVLEELERLDYPYVIVTTGGRLLKKAKESNAPLLEVPKGLQPRLSSGYFIAGIIKILSNVGLIEDLSGDLISIASRIDESLKEDKTKELAKALTNKVPIIYSTAENESIAKASKIKFNENTKIQAFYNAFPELNHNEMVGFTKLLMDPFFVIYQSKFTHKRNLKRIEIFTKLMKEKDVPVEIVEMWGESIFEEILTSYYFIDHVTYYLAEAYGMDPEPVEMVEEFKELLKS